MIPRISEPKKPRNFEAKKARNKETKKPINQETKNQESTNQETLKPKNQETFFQVRESPPPVNIPTPTPVPDHLLGGHERLGDTMMFPNGADHQILCCIMKLSRDCCSDCCNPLRKSPNHPPRTTIDELAEEVKHHMLDEQGKQTTNSLINSFIEGPGK